jgi:hypothetical protein
MVRYSRGIYLREQTAPEWIGLQTEIQIAKINVKDHRDIQYMRQFQCHHYSLALSVGSNQADSNVVHQDRAA